MRFIFYFILFMKLFDQLSAFHHSTYHKLFYRNDLWNCLKIDTHFSTQTLAYLRKFLIFPHFKAKVKNWLAQNLMFKNIIFIVYITLHFFQLWPLSIAVRQWMSCFGALSKHAFYIPGWVFIYLLLIIS